MEKKINVIKDILEVLNLDDYYNESEYIEQAKGRYKFPDNLKELKRSIKRTIKWQSKG